MPGLVVNGRFVYEFGEFVVDPNDKTISVGAESIQIPPKEFDTLLLLIENNGRVVTKAEMMSALWQDTFVEEGNLATYVSRLRKIVNKNGEKIIETVPKVGYRFKAKLKRADLIPDGALLIEKRTVRKLELEIESDNGTTTGEATGQRSFRRKLMPALAIGALVIIAAVAAVIYFAKRTEPVAANIGSIAVLPFRPINNDDRTRVLGLGLSDALISRIGTLHRIIVRPTSAVARFADAQQDSLEIGRRLNVDAVLEGTIQQADGRLRISARLLRTRDGDQLWAEKYDETGVQLFDAEDRLSSRIADTLTFKLTNTENERLARRGTDNTDAYEKYLQGRFYQRQNSADGLKRSIDLYQEAIALDPNFADAHAGIADAELLMYNFGIELPSEIIPKARQSVRRALELSPDLSEAYTSLAMIQFLADHDSKSAEASLKMAISLNPSNADAFHRYGYFLTNEGKFEEALGKYKEALAIDPLSPIVQTGIGLNYLYSRRFSDAISQLEMVTSENPQFSMPQWFLATSYDSVGDQDKAFALDMRALELDGEADLANRLRSVKAGKGLDAANIFWRDELLAAEKNGKESALNVAWCYATLGDRQNTVTWLKKAFDDGEPTISQIKFLAKYDFVRDDPQFQSLANQLSY